jgi:hypothetical protein
MTRSPASTDELLRHTLGHLPELLAALDELHETAWSATDHPLLDLCRTRMATLLGLGPDAPIFDPELIAKLTDWPTSSRFSTRQRACLAFTEQFVIDVASITNEQVAAVAVELGDDGLVNFVNSLLVVEQRLRMHLIWKRLALA